MEQLVDLAYTTLSASYTAGSGSLTVASSTTGSGPLAFPASVPFSVNIVDQSTGSVKALLKVTAIPDGTHFTVTSDGLDANAVSGDFVYAIQDSASLVRLLAEYGQVGAYSSLPATGSSREGQLYKNTDSAAQYLLKSAAWSPSYGLYPITTPPAVSNFTAQNGGTLADGPGTMILTGDTTKTWQPFIRNAPATPYTITVGMEAAYAPSNCGAGLCFSDGAGKYTYLLVGADLGVFYSTSFTTSSSLVSFTSGGLMMAPKAWLRIADNGANRLYSVSANGQDWSQIYSEGRTTNFTATKVGLVALTQASGFLKATYFSYVAA